MTREDYELIADIIKNTPNVDDDKRRALAQDFADDLAETNPRFDSIAFLIACGVQANKGA